jgi:hypothetical protein
MQGMTYSQDMFETKSITRWYIRVNFYFQFQLDLTPTSVPSVEVRLAVSVEPPPPGLETAHQTLFTPSAVQFVAELVETFDKQVDEVTFGYTQDCSRVLV